MQRYDIINWLIEKYGYKSYLEIGVAAGECFEKIEGAHRTCIDPAEYAVPHAFHRTSDEFFSQAHKWSAYDIIFIDGEHLEAQVMRDITNSLKHLSPNGTIVVHDCNPPLANTAVAEPRVFVRHGDRPEYSLWNGTVWKAFVRTRLFNKDVTTRCVDADWGCGIIQRGPWIPWDGELEDETVFRPKFNYDMFAERRWEYLNLITPKQFKEIYNGR